MLPIPKQPLTASQIYLTSLFLVPLFHAYSFHHRSKSNDLRRTVLRAFLGGMITLASSVANLLTLVFLKEEQSWICLLCCNSDSKGTAMSEFVIDYLTRSSSLQRSRSPVDDKRRWIDGSCFLSSGYTQTTTSRCISSLEFFQKRLHRAKAVPSESWPYSQSSGPHGTGHKAKQTGSGSFASKLSGDEFERGIYIFWTDRQRGSDHDPEDGVPDGGVNA